MLNNKIAILVDNFTNNPQTQLILTEVLSKKYDVTIFTISKENIIANPLPVFNIADYFNWQGISIITSPRTLEKTISYPSIGPCIIVGNVKYKDYFNIGELNLDLISGIINENRRN